jgi:hypothetical protein
MSMTPRHRSLAVLVVGLTGSLLLAPAAFVSPWLAVVAAVLTTAALLAQHRTSGVVSVRFLPEDWLPAGDDRVLAIPRSDHGRRSPNVAVWMQCETGELEEVMCDTSERHGDLRIAVTTTSVPMLSMVGEVRIT